MSIFLRSALILILLSFAACGGSSSEGTLQANAGNDLKVLVSDNVTVDGLSSTGVGSGTNVTWSFNSKPSGSGVSFSDSITLTPKFTPDVEGDYEVQLTLSRGGSSSTNTATITAKNVLANCTAPGGATLTRLGKVENVINLGGTGRVSGSSSRVASGHSITSYAWNQASGAGATPIGAVNAVTLDFTAGGLVDILNLASPSGGNFGISDRVSSDRYKYQVMRISRLDTQMIFTLTVTDDGGNTDTSTCPAIYLQDAGQVINTQSGLPNVGVGSKVYFSWANLIALGASATDTTKEFGSPITNWTATLSLPTGSSATLSNANTEFPSFVPDVAGIYTVTYRSTDTAIAPKCTSATSTCNLACRMAGGSTITSNCVSAKKWTDTSVSTSCSTACNIYGSAGVQCTCGVAGELLVNASTYAGVGTIGGTTPEAPQCAKCHGTSPVSGLDDKLTPWSGTIHSHVFADNADNGAYAGLAPTPYLWEYHTVGYNGSASSGGFDALASLLGFSWSDQTYQKFLNSFDKTSSHYLPKLANVQCENCHGPGASHSVDDGKIASSSAQQGVCGQCHFQASAWMNSDHNTTGVAHGSGSYQISWLTNSSCARCHTSQGFAAYVEGGEAAVVTAVANLEKGAFVSVACAACHDPHDATNDHQLREKGNVTMITDGSTVDAGKAAVCYTCHDGFYNYGEHACNAAGAASTAAGTDLCEDLDNTAITYSRQAHYNPQAPVLEGKQILNDLGGDGTEDFALDENSFHSSAAFTLAAVSGNPDLENTNNKCVTCHMAPGPSPTEEGYLHLGGHAFKLQSGHGLSHLQPDEPDEPSTPGTEGSLEYTAACTTCHTSLTTFNRTARADYDGNGSIDGIQDEIKGLLYTVAKMIYYIDHTCTLGGVGGVGTSCTVHDNLTSTGTSGFGTTCDGALPDFAYPTLCTGTINVGTIGYKSTTGVGFFKSSPIIRRATWNYNSIVRDGSLGVHNAAYTIKTLQGTYKALRKLLPVTTPVPSTFTYQSDFTNAALR